MIVKYSSHSRERMVLRGISEKEVENAIKLGKKYLQKPNKIVSEYGYFSVVYRKSGDAHYVITVQPKD